MCAYYQFTSFVRLLAQIIMFFNFCEFTSQNFNDYCISTGITVEHPVADVHTQNGLTKSLIKYRQLIARPIFMIIKLSISLWLILL